MKASMKIAAVAGLVAAACSSAYAAGFMLTEQSAAGLGRAYAGIGVDGTDISGVFYNPATMTLHPGTQIQAGFVAIGLDLAYEGNSGATENGRDLTTPIPHGYISHQISDDMWIGLAMTVPFGMGTEFDDNWELSKRGISAQVLTFDFNPNVAWKVSDKLSIGAGMSIQYAQADLKKADNVSFNVPFGEKHYELGSMDGEIDCDSWAWGFNLGLMWTPVENVRLGLSYRSSVNHHADGDFTLSNPKLNEERIAALVGAATQNGMTQEEIQGQIAGMQGMIGQSFDGSASLSTPDWLMATAAWDVNDLLSLYATFRWTDWSSFESLDIKSPALATQGGKTTINNYWQDTYLFSVGADLRFTNWWTFRAGIGYETSPIDDPRYRTAIIPDADRWWFALGSSFQVAKDFQIDVSAAMLHGTGERDLYESETAKEPSGRFDKLDAYLFGVQLLYKF